MKNENATVHELSAAVSDFIDTLCNIADENNKNRDDLINTAGSLLCFLTHTTTFQNNSPKETLMEKHWKECMQIARYDDRIKALEERIDRLMGIIDGLCGYLGGEGR